MDGKFFLHPIRALAAADQVRSFNSGAANVQI